MTPNEAFKNEKFQAVQQLNNSAINQNIYKSIDFNNGDNVRILQDKVYLIKVKINSVMMYLKLKDVKVKK